MHKTGRHRSGKVPRPAARRLSALPALAYGPVAVRANTCSLRPADASDAAPDKEPTSADDAATDDASYWACFFLTPKRKC